MLAGTVRHVQIMNLDSSAATGYTACLRCLSTRLPRRPPRMPWAARCRPAPETSPTTRSTLHRSLKGSALNDPGPLEHLGPERQAPEPQAPGHRGPTVPRPVWTPLVTGP